MRRNELLIQFIVDNNYTDERINSLMENTLLDRKQLITKTFKTINSFLGTFINNEYESNIVMNGCKLLFVLCEQEDFNEEQVMYTRNRIKKTREAILALGNKYKNEKLFESANILDEIILDKKIDVESIITLIKKLIDKKEDVNIIKKILSTNRGAIILDDNKLFDYTFYLAIDSLSNSTDDIYYYISLLKIFYTTKIDKDKYIRMLNIVSDDTNIFANEIYSILYGYKRSLTGKEVINKYGIIDKICNVNINNNKVCNRDNAITIDKEKTEIRDDAISIARLRNKFIVGLHIADVGLSIVPFSEADYIARNNYKCLYLGGNKRLRLFSNNTEKDLSLNENNRRNVISLYVVMNDAGDILDYYIVKNNIIVRQNLTYDEADKIINHGVNSDFSKDLNVLYDLSLALSNKYTSKKEYWSKKGKEVTSKSNNIISEFMVLYNYLIAQIAKDNDIDYVYRIQEESYFDGLIKSLNLELDESTLKVINNIYLKSKYSNEPLYHSGLGLDIYSHSADPIRRYPDLFNQYLLHKYYFKDISFNISYEEFLNMIAYFNQRNTELNLMRSEYTRTLKKS